MLDFYFNPIPMDVLKKDENLKIFTAHDFTDENRPEGIDKDDSRIFFTLAGRDAPVWDYGKSVSVYHLQGHTGEVPEYLHERYGVILYDDFLEFMNANMDMFVIGTEIVQEKLVDNSLEDLPF